ncbi:MAG: ROK family protein [Bacteroidetes bacterium]|nr:ROK family protein [Bacteroidota bacterium]
MPESRLVFGADGGGTKTLGILADASGTELARMQLGPGNPNIAGVDVAARNLLELIAGCCEGAKRSPHDIGSAVFGLAGVGGKTIRQKLQEALQTLCIPRGWSLIPMTIETDARVALEGAFGGGPGVVMIAGTGSNLIGKMPDGTIDSVGGWGRVLGDEGGGYFLGLETAKAVARDIDGRGEAKVLRALLADRFGWVSRDRIVASVYQEKFDLASIAPLVLDAAAEGDPVANTLLHKSARHLADTLAALVRRMPGISPVGVVFIGGLIDHDTVYARIVRDTISEVVPGAEVRPPLYPPVRGAVIMAQHLMQRK